MSAKSHWRPDEPATHSEAADPRSDLVVMLESVATGEMQVQQAGAVLLQWKADGCTKPAQLPWRSFSTIFGRAAVCLPSPGGGAIRARRTSRAEPDQTLSAGGLLEQIAMANGGSASRMLADSRTRTSIMPEQSWQRSRTAYVVNFRSPTVEVA